MRTLVVEDVPTGGTYDLRRQSVTGEKGTVLEGNTPSFCCRAGGKQQGVIRFQENTYGWLPRTVTLEAGKNTGCIVLGKEGGLILSGVSVRRRKEKTITELSNLTNNNK